MLKRTHSLPEDLIQKVNTKLERYNVQLTNSTKISDAIMFMSDFYINNPMAATPWQERLTWISQLAYYFPLNYLRNDSVAQELKNFFDLNSFSKIIDYGSGLGTSSWCFKKNGFTKSIFQFERETKLKNYWEENQFHWLANKEDLLKQIDSQTLGVFSYSLTEIADTLPLLEKFNYLVILEPSTQSDGRKLMELRKELIKKDYIIDAPCTHQYACPLLENSKKDWCHDRIHFKKPDWFQKIEDRLPIKNDTLTFSYLIAHRRQIHGKILKKTEMPLLPLDHSLARITGDLLHEKGKSKQLVCLNSERIFLSWLHKVSKPQEIGRGHLVSLSSELPKISNEIRLSSDQEPKVLR